MAIVLPSGFQITSKDPIDSRITVANQAARLGFSAANIYNGLVVFQRDTNELYVLKDTGSAASNTGWNLVGSGSGGAGTIEYVSGSSPYPAIGGIEVKDFDDEVLIQYDAATEVLTFVFGIPATPVPTTTNTTPTYTTDRFNKVLLTYGVTGTFDLGANILISASLRETTSGDEKVLSGPTGTGASIVVSENTSGSRSYVLEITSSNPATSAINKQLAPLTLTLNKLNADIPTLAYTPDVELGAVSLQIEEGATGSIAFTSDTGSNDRDWVFVPTTLVTTPATSPITLISSDKADKSIFATADYSSSGAAGADNDPALKPSNYSDARRVSATRTYSRIISVRAGTSTSTTFTETELQNLGNWVGGAGQVQGGTIQKGVTNPNGASVSMTWTGDKYQYIVYDASLSNLTAIKDAALNLNVLKADGAFTGLFATVGGYKIYRTAELQAGPATQGYNLEI